MSLCGNDNFVQGKTTSLKKAIVYLFAAVGFAVCAAKGYDAAVEHNLVNPELKKLIAQTSTIVHKASFGPQAEINTDRNARSQFIVNFGNPTTINLVVGDAKLENFVFEPEETENGNVKYIAEGIDDNGRALTLRRDPDEGILGTRTNVGKDMDMYVNLHDYDVVQIVLSKKMPDGRTIAYEQSWQLNGTVVTASMGTSQGNQIPMDPVRPLLPFGDTLKAVKEALSLLEKADAEVQKRLAESPDFPAKKHKNLSRFPTSIL